jgi:WbqC-like protein family
MRVAIHQPQYLPWLGYFDKMDRADCFVILDDVQFKKNEWQNRNRIKTPAGWQWLTVPVRHRFPQRISEVRLDGAAPWPRKHLGALVANYSGAPAFERHRPFLEESFARPWDRLLDLSLGTLGYLMGALGIETKLVLASALDPAPAENATDRLIAICRAVGADTYLSGTGGRDYLDAPRFDRAGLRVEVQAFRCPVYPQRFGGFEPNLSIVDLLFNCGAESLAILRGGARP